MFDDSTQNNVWINVSGGITSKDNANCLKFNCNAGDIFSLKADFETTHVDNIIMLAFYDKNNNLLNRQAQSNSATLFLSLTAPSNTAYMYAGHYGKIPETIQLVKGSYTSGTMPTYTAHQEQNLPINLGDIELCKIGTAQDYIYKDSGKWYVHKETAEYVFTGNENWADYSDSQSGDYYKFYSTGVKFGRTNNMEANAFCSHFKNNAFYSNVNAIGLTQNATYISIDKTIADTKESLKSWFATKYASNPVKLKYIKATPTNTEITETTLINQLEAIRKAKSYNEVTNISQENNDLPFIIDLQYLMKEGVSNGE